MEPGHQQEHHWVFFFTLENISHPTHWDQNEMAAILQTAFPNIFSAMKCFVFCLNFHWNLFPWDELPISMCNIYSSNGLVLKRQQANTWISGEPDYWCHTVSLGQNESRMVYNELTHCGLVMPHVDKTGSTLSQVMVCYLTAPSHYLNQC